MDATDLVRDLLASEEAEAAPTVADWIGRAQGAADLDLAVERALSRVAPSTPSPPRTSPPPSYRPPPSWSRSPLPAGGLDERLGEGQLPGSDAEAQEILDIPVLRVSVASARYLLAPKVAAARVDRDADDIRVLADICGLTAPSAVLALAVEASGSSGRCCRRSRAGAFGLPD